VGKKLLDTDATLAMRAFGVRPYGQACLRQTRIPGIKAGRSLIFQYKNQFRVKINDYVNFFAHKNRISSDIGCQIGKAEFREIRGALYMGI
jgi:hypothetical protein